MQTFQGEKLMTVASALRNLLPSKQQPKHSSPEHDTSCRNCATPITSNFCPECGQSAHVHHSLLHLIEEMAHGLWHFDAKGWRTIPLLFAFPGELTRRYIDGQRVRFISPLALFLFSVFFMFFAMSFGSDHHNVTENGKVTAEQVGIEVKKGVKEELDATKKQIAKLQNDIAAAQKAGKNSDALTEQLQQEQSSQKQLETLIDASGNLTEKNVLNLNGARIQFDQIKWLKESIKHVQDNPDLFMYKMKSYAYKFALILVPVSLPFLWLVFFWRRGISMFDHAVFTLYSLSFMALFFGVFFILADLELGPLAGILCIILPPVHMFRQLRGTYGLSTWETLWRTAYLLLVAVVMVVLFLLFILGLSAH